jgi:hypothetical protein
MSRLRVFDGWAMKMRICGHEMLSREEGIPPLPAFGNEKGWV